MNEIAVLGKALGKPEVKEGQKGTKYASMLVSVKKPFKDEYGSYETETFQFTLFKDVAERANELIDNGTPILIKGHLSANNREKDGTTYYGASLIADTFTILSADLI